MTATVRFLPDTNCIVAALSTQHPHHQRARGEIQLRLVRGEGMVLAAHCLVEAYSVLTRLPRPHRVAPADALRQLTTSFVERAETVALETADYLSVLRRVAGEGVFGGRVYDALIGSCAAKAGVDAFLTFNERHFRALLPSSVEIVVPSE